MPTASIEARSAAIVTLFIAISLACFSRANAAERARNITFDHLKFDLKSGDPFERSMLGKKIEALNGKPIVVRGFILPAYTPKLKNFVLMRDNMECCFGPGAAMCDSIQVDMDPGLTARYTPVMVAVEGVLTIREFKDVDGVVRSVYHLQATKVK